MYTALNTKTVNFAEGRLGSVATLFRSAKKYKNLRRTASRESADVRWNAAGHRTVLCDVYLERDPSQTSADCHSLAVCTRRYWSVLSILTSWALELWFSSCSHGAASITPATRSWLPQLLVSSPFPPPYFLFSVSRQYICFLVSGWTPTPMLIARCWIIDEKLVWEAINRRLE